MLTRREVLKSVAAMAISLPVITGLTAPAEQYPKLYFTNIPSLDHEVGGFRSGSLIGINGNNAALEKFMKSFKLSNPNIPVEIIPAPKWDNFMDLREKLDSNSEKLYFVHSNESFKNWNGDRLSWLLDVALDISDVKDYFEINVCKNRWGGKLTTYCKPISTGELKEFLIIEVSNENINFSTTILLVDNLGDLFQEGQEIARFFSRPSYNQINKDICIYAHRLTEEKLNQFELCWNRSKSVSLVRKPYLNSESVFIAWEKVNENEWTEIDPVRNSHYSRRIDT
jgi:hypothetical protein